MRKRDSLGFRLFIIFSSFLIVFVGLITFLQLFVVGRMYTTSNYVQQREKELYNLVPKFIYSNIYNGYNFGKIGSPQYDTQGMEEFERLNDVNLLVFDNTVKTRYITNTTKAMIKPSYISNIQSTIREEGGRISPGAPMSFRVYGAFHIPTKYIAVVFETQYATHSSDFVVAVIPEVFTSSTSNILRSYLTYIVMFSLLITFALSALFSYIVVRPISQMNKTASRMADMDFSAKCRIEHNDEIGSLAGTLNYLSDSLKIALGKLHDTNDSLKKDLDLQKELDTMRKDFIAAITHDFKTPITLIRGYSEGIKDNVAEGEDREFAVDTIIRETEKIDQLVNDILDLSTLESVGYKLNISSFNISSLINSIAKMYEKVIENRKVQLKTETLSYDIYAKGDSFRIEQVVTNFLNNAISHTSPQKEIILSLKDMGDYVVIAVQNQGEHISPEELKRIWERFYRVEKSRNKKYGGSGLGLAISDAILKLHNSSYGAQNTEDGVRFYFSLQKENI